MTLAVKQIAQEDGKDQKEEIPYYRCLTPATLHMKPFYV